jgi:DNA helicase HerA-like ATPase
MSEAAILVGKGEIEVPLLARYGNRHGLITGATGTGKTVTLKTLAEGFSRLGVPVFMADVKGDIAGLAMPGESSDKLQQRLATMGISGWSPAACPTVFWDLYQKQGHPLRATVSEVGPVLLSRMLELSEPQEGILQIVFAVADDQGLLLLDLDDLRSLLNHVVENKDEIGRKYGLVSEQSVAGIQRQLLALSREGGEAFFGEPALDLADFMRQDLSGNGIINVLASDQLLLKPKLYSTALLWLLSELFENLPEVGDLDRPKLVFFFDEAHLLFSDAPKALVDRIEQVVRLIRSKGVGVYFCTQSPADLPDAVLAQLGNRVQHRLSAATPREQKAVKVAAETFVPNPKLKVAEVIGQLATGEALLSMLDAKGAPMPVQRALVAPPRCRFGALTPEERQAIRMRSPVGGKYDTTVNRESAHELLAQRAQAQAPAAPAAAAASPGGWWDGGRFGKPQPQAPQPRAPRPSNRQGVGEAFVKSAARSIGSQLGRSLLRGVLGSLTRR